jgi:hypothetical protein
MRPAWVAFGALILVMSSGCRTARVLYKDFDRTQLSFGDLIQRSPYIVVAVVDGPRVKSGPAGLVARPNNWPPFPAQRYQFTLTVERSLRGELPASETISVLGYQSEDKVFIGSPQGLCGQPGERAIYFLKKIGDTFWVMQNQYVSWVDLDGRMDLSAVKGEDDIALTIWRLMAAPLKSGARRTTHNKLSDIFEVTGAELGRARWVKLMSAAMSDSSNRDFKVETCVWLNTVEWGLGLEKCAEQLREEPGISERQRADLNEALSKAPGANAEMRSILETRDNPQIAFWANSNDPIKIRDFLCLLTGHTDRKIVKMASKLLMDHYGGAVCSAAR